MQNKNITVFILNLFKNENRCFNLGIIHNKELKKSIKSLVRLENITCLLFKKFCKGDFLEILREIKI